MTISCLDFLSELCCCVAPSTLGHHPLSPPPACAWPHHWHLVPPAAHSFFSSSVAEQAGPSSLHLQSLHHSWRITVLQLLPIWLTELSSYITDSTHVRKIFQVRISIWICSNELPRQLCIRYIAEVYISFVLLS